MYIYVCFIFISFSFFVFLKIFLKIKKGNSFLEAVINSILEIYSNIFLVFFLKRDLNKLLNNTNYFIFDNNKSKKIKFSYLKFNFEDNLIIFEFVPKDFISINFFNEMKNLILLKKWIGRRFHNYSFSEFFEENYKYTLKGRLSRSEPHRCQ